MRVRVVLVTLVVALIAGGVAWWLAQRERTAFEDALGTLPQRTLRAAYTDWAQVRAAVDTGPRLGPFLTAAYDRGLSRTSALESNAAQLVDHYGIDLRESAWEMYGQSEEGSVAVLRVDRGTSFDQLRDTLRGLGYGEPESATGAWTGDEELTTSIDPGLTPVLHNALLVEAERLVIFSDTASYADTTAKVVDGSSDSLLETIAGLVDRVDDPAGAILWAEDYACEALTMSTADEPDQTLGEDLVADAGGIDPLSGLLMAGGTAGEVRVVMEFEDSAQADDNLQPRTDLASGASPGLGGSFTDRFSVTSGETDDRFVVLDLEPAPDQSALLSAISDGPVLFATC